MRHLEVGGVVVVVVVVVVIVGIVDIVGVINATIVVVVGGCCGIVSEAFFASCTSVSSLREAQLWFRC